MSGSRDPRVDRALLSALVLFFALCAWTFQGLANEVAELRRDFTASRQDHAALTTRVAVVEARIARTP